MVDEEVSDPRKREILKNIIDQVELLRAEQIGQKNPLEQIESERDTPESGGRQR